MSSALTAHPIPAAALANHIAIVGKTGSGKTFAAKGTVEQLLAGGARTVIVDPTGVWYGLRLARDGRRASPFKIPVFGGQHADLPLTTDGEALARILGGSATSAILDVQQLSVGQRTRFFTGFAEALLRENRGPLHLVLDEAHLFAPQGGSAGFDQTQLLHATNNLVSLGRSAGLRITLISQRPAKIHKDALTQVETMVAMRVISPQDRKAVADWLAGAPDSSRTAEIMSTLASLQVGEGWVYAPEQGVLERARFPAISTFDSGRPLEVGEMPALKPLDVAALREAMSQISASDDAAKRDKIAPARRGSEPSAAPSRPASAEEIAAAEARGYERGRADGIAAGAIAGARVGWNNAISHYRRHVESFGAGMPDSSLLDAMTEVAIDEAPASTSGRARQTPPARGVSSTAPPPSAAVRMNGHAPRAKGAITLTGPQRQLLKALAWWKAMGHPTPSRAQVAAIAGWKITSGHLKNVAGSLTSAGLISYPKPGWFAFTDEGAAIAPEPDLQATLVESLSSTLTVPQRTALDALLEGNRRLTRTDLARRCRWEPTSGHVKNVIGSLSTLEIVQYPEPGLVELQDWVR